MASTVLDKIVADKRDWIAAKKQALPLEQFRAGLTPSDRSFISALKARHPAFILECKKASPSKGLIRPQFDLDLIASTYTHYAAAISVLTDEKYFQGKFDYVTQVRNQVSQPVLCKDFFVDPYQIYLARHHGADVILLMLSVLDDEQYRTLYQVAESLNIDVLTEVSNEDEMQRAIALGSPVIGINNRDLRDLSIDLAQTEKLAPLAPPDRLLISESGIYTHPQVRRLAPHVQGFLVGSSLMSQDNVDLACRKLIHGEYKICGLTRAADAAHVYAESFSYGGLIFHPKSPRCVSLAHAQTICAAAPLGYVGVFVDADIEQMVSIADTLQLTAIQLHGNETQACIDALRQRLPASVQIWKALKVDTALPAQIPDNVDRVLLDSVSQGQFGGTGVTFDWSLLQASALAPHCLLAGGLSPDNAAQALAIGTAGLDFNSGVESAPGEKSAEKITQLRQILAQV